MAASDRAPAPPLVRVGVVTRAHGIRGEVAVRSLEADSTTTLLAQRQVFLGAPGSGAPPQLRAVQAARTAGAGQLLVRFEGVADRTEAEKFAGLEVLVPRAALPALEPDEFYVGDLLGLRARRPSGEPLGRVEAVLDTGGVPVLEIRGEREWQAPLAAPFVHRIDVAAGELVVEPVEEDEAPEA